MLLPPNDVEQILLALDNCGGFAADPLNQAPQTRGPRAACSPREGLMRPPNILKDQENIEI